MILHRGSYNAVFGIFDKSIGDNRPVFLSCWRAVLTQSQDLHTSKEAVHGQERSCEGTARTADPSNSGNTSDKYFLLFPLFEISTVRFDSKYSS